MDAYRRTYLELRLKGLSHAAAFTLAQSVLGVMTPSQRKTFEAWAKARERQASTASAQLVTASPG